MSDVRQTPRIVGLVATLLATASLAAAAEDDRFGAADLARLADVAEPAFSPDGEYLAYSVTTSNLETDAPQSDLWRVRYTGGPAEPLTRTPDASEWLPAWSPDGKSIAFLADRGGKDATTQVWLLPAFGGEARKLTDFPGGVEDFAWSPDGRSLAITATDPERPAGKAAPPKPPPIVTGRYMFKEDEHGYLTDRRRHLYVYTIDGGGIVQLGTGASDEYLPAWSPDGAQIAYVSKRGGDADRHLNFDIYLVEPRAGATERRLTSFSGADLDPSWGGRPAWSPDGKRIAYMQGGDDKWIYYAPWQLAIIDVASGAARIPAPIDRCFSQPRWSPDGRSVLTLIEHSRVTHLSRVDAASGKVTPLTSGPRFDTDVAVAPDGRIAVLGGDDWHPYELAAVERNGLRPLTDHNAFLRQKRLAAVEPIEFRSADGAMIDGFLLKPLDYVSGRRYPTILRLHGGPVYQFSHEFMPDWQSYAAQGYAVVAANPRGGSGRGFDFARAIYADWGNKDVQDVLAAIDHVVKLGIADSERLGVGGRSYGGILTNYVIASDQRFKAAVSGAGASNFAGLYGADQYSSYYELELGTPWRNRDVYERLSYPFNHAERIRTPTLFYCAGADFNVPCHGSEQMYQALRTQDVPTQLVIYPDEYHSLSVPSYRRDRLTRHVAWYDRFLKPGAGASAAAQ